MAHSSEDMKALFEAYLEVCNQALDQHKEEFPYKYIWKAAESVQGESGISLSLYDDEPQEQYTVKLKDAHIDAAPMEKCPKKGWRVNKSYLKKVTENPEEYIRNPAKLDWDWLKNRIED